MALLKGIGPPNAVVETDYRGSVAYFTRSPHGLDGLHSDYPLWAVLQPRTTGICTVPIVRSALQADDAEFLMVGDVNIPGLVDSPCLLQLASTSATGKAVGAVRLISTDHDQTSVFELLGPGSHPATLGGLDRRE